MNLGSVVEVVRDGVVPFLVLFVLPLFFWYTRDRRKNKVEADVAERTVGVDVSIKETGGLGASVSFMTEAFRIERDSYLREIASLRTKVEALEVSEAAKDRRIDALEAVEEEKDRIIAQHRRQISELTARIDVLERNGGSTSTAKAARE